MAKYCFVNGHSLTQPVIILGAGGHARVLLDTLRAITPTVKILGMTDADDSLFGQTVDDCPVLGPDSVLLQYSPDRILLVNGLGSTRATQARTRIFATWKEQGYRFASLIHPTAWVSPRATLGEGVQILAGAVVQTGGKIGDNVLVNTKTSVDHDCLIANHVHLAPGVTLSGNVTVQEQVHIGTGATLIQGITLAAHGLVAAGAVVIRDSQPQQILAGVPAHPIPHSTKA